LTIYYHTLPSLLNYPFSIPVESFFTSTLPYGFLLIVPMIALLFVNKRHSY
jgi:uncharacterized membrane protein